jgi:hypothetical protein
MQTHQPGIDFGLAPGGPIDRLQTVLKIRGEHDAKIGVRALITALVVWLPLAVITVVDPVPEANIPFLYDIAAHVRFLLLVPLLILAEASIGGRSRVVVAQFLASGLVGEGDAGRFESAKARGRALLDSWVAELLIITISALLVTFQVRTVLAEDAVFWFERVTAHGSTLSRAGWWYAMAATPVFVYLMLRWLWRYLVWWWFLGRVARLDLNLTGTHPDRFGGLGFVVFHHSAFAVLTFAVGCAVSAAAANRILYAGVELQSYRTPIIAIALGAVLFGVAPMLVFTPRLVRAKRRSWLTYSRFASDYVWKFEQKWLGAPKAGEEALGSGDIQSLADLGGSFERMVAMRPVAIDRRLIVVFVIAAVAPALPLLLTVMPLRDIIRTLLKAMI